MRLHGCITTNPLSAYSTYTLYTCTHAHVTACTVILCIHVHVRTCQECVVCRIVIDCVAGTGPFSAHTLCIYTAHVTAQNIMYSHTFMYTCL